MNQSLGANALWWAREFFPMLPALLPRWIGAWVLSLLILRYGLVFLRPHLRARIAAFDIEMNNFARRLRYKLQQADAALEPNRPPRERVLLTWFFRFWTNFASAPSLSIISIALPIWMFHQSLNSGINYLFSTPLRFTEKWLLPALFYFGSMGLSYVLKRVFKRARPERKTGAFGHALRDGSFPSGHSLTAFAFWIGCVFAVMQNSSAGSTLLMLIVAATIIFLTGLSRIYMAVHWPSDVAGGYVIGAVWSLLCFLALRGAL